MRIMSFGQQVLLDAQMTVVNQLVVELPDGRQVAVPTSEETVQTLMKLHMGIDPNTVVNLGPVAESRPPESEDQEDEDVDPGEVYGGDVQTLMGSLDDDAPVEILPAKKLKSPRGRREGVGSDGFVRSAPARTVPADSMGYPQVPAGTVVPKQRTLLEDEDGEQI